MRERKTIEIYLIKSAYEGAVHAYEQFSGKKFEPNNGWSQVPKNNFEAAMYYGRVDAFRSLLK